MKLPSIPEALKFRADQMGWNQSELALRLGLQRSHMSEVLSGKRKLPALASSRAFHLGVTPEVLLPKPTDNVKRKK